MTATDTESKATPATQTESIAPIIDIGKRPVSDTSIHAESRQSYGLREQVFVYGSDDAGEDRFSGIGALRFVLLACVALLVPTVGVLLLFAFNTSIDQLNLAKHEGVGPSTYLLWVLGLLIVAAQCWAQRDLLTIAVLLSAHSKHQSDVLQEVAHELLEIRAHNQAQGELLAEIVVELRRQPAGSESHG